MLQNSTHWTTLLTPQFSQMQLCFSQYFSSLHPTSKFSWGGWEVRKCFIMKRSWRGQSMTDWMIWFKRYGYLSRHRSSETSRWCLLHPPLELRSWLCHLRPAIQLSLQLRVLRLVKLFAGIFSNFKLTWTEYRRWWKWGVVLQSLGWEAYFKVSIFQFPFPGVTSFLSSFLGLQLQTASFSRHWRCRSSDHYLDRFNS